MSIQQAGRIVSGTTVSLLRTIGVWVVGPVNAYTGQLGRRPWDPRELDIYWSDPL